MGGFRGRRVRLADGFSGMAVISRVGAYGIQLGFARRRSKRLSFLYSGDSENGFARAEWLYPSYGVFFYCLDNYAVIFPHLEVSRRVAICRNSSFGIYFYCRYIRENERRIFYINPIVLYWCIAYAIRLN